MKKFLYCLLGIIIGGIACNLLFFAISKLALAFDLRLFNGEEEASRNFLIFLILFFVFIIGGGIKGYLIGKK